MLGVFKIEEWFSLVNTPVYYKGTCYNLYHKSKTWSCGSNDKKYVEKKLLSNLYFDSDLNWLAEAKKFICSLEKVDEFDTLYDSMAKGYHCRITPAYKNSFETLYTDVFEEEIQAVFTIVSDFAKLYNRKEL